MKGPYLEQHEMQQLEVLLPHAIRDTMQGWKATRLRGASASMAFYGNVSSVLLKAFDELAAEIRAQQDQEPVQYKCTVTDDSNLRGVPLEQWVKPTQHKDWRWHDLSLHDIKSAIEAKLKEKNNV